MKRLFDLLVSGLGLLFLAPVFVAVVVAIWLEDRHGPFYFGRRVGKDGRVFSMVKFRSMTPRADRTGLASTASNDPRITRVGAWIRRLKLDEFSQLVNVFRGDMSLVGPRPQVEQDVALYTEVERGLLAARPGITDFSSIVFADEGEILRGAEDPDLRYQQLIRPWKSRMGLHYVAVASLWLDLRLVVATLLAAASRPRALAWVSAMLAETGAEPQVVRVALRTDPLVPTPPPGAAQVVSAR